MQISAGINKEKLLLLFIPIQSCVAAPVWVVYGQKAVPGHRVKYTHGVVEGQCDHKILRLNNEDVCNT